MPDPGPRIRASQGTRSRARHLTSAPRRSAEESAWPAEEALRAFRLDDRVALVTGASSGLGRRFAAVLASAGATVVAAARRLEKLQELAAEHPNVHPYRCDLSDPEEARRLVTVTHEGFGRLDIVINNAGINDVIEALNESPEQFRQVLSINLVAPFVLCQQAARYMIADGISGSIVNVASILGLVGLGQIPEAGYAASKGGLIVLTRELAAQWARRGIRVNALAPGFFPSELTHELFETESGQKWLAKKAPMGRGGREHELDGALLYLASDASSYVTGHVLTVDGGWTAV